MTELTDFESHHIEGFVNSQHLKVPLISHIKDNLWTGGCRDGVQLPEDFKYVVSLYMWEQYELPKGANRIEIKMYDHGEVPDEGLLFALGDLVADLCARGLTLVHCQAGLNRSGLVGALGLMAMGHSADDAIVLLREKRSDLVLCNSVFENWLREVGKR